MRKLKLALVITLFSIQLFGGFLEEEISSKIYTTHEQLQNQIEFIDGGILFYVPENELPYLVKTISYDKKGVCVELSSCQHQPKCPKCGGCYYFKNCTNNCVCIKRMP
jgi:hypothetical protein